MKLKIQRGTTNKIVRVFIQNSSSSSGAGLTGLTNASSGLTAYYIREGDATTTAITLAAGTVGTYSSGGFKEVDSTNMPGVYELGVPNAVLASGNSAVIYLQGATNMVPNVTEVELDAVGYQDSMRFGLAALPNVNAGAAGGLPTGNASGQVDIDMAQALPSAVTPAAGNPTENLGNALIAALVQANGKWVLSGTTLTLYRADGTTVWRTFTLDSSTSPTQRT